MPVHVDFPAKQADLARELTPIWDQAAELLRQATSGLDEASKRGSRYTILYWSVGSIAAVVGAVAAVSGLKDLVAPIAAAVIVIAAAALEGFVQFASPRKRMAEADRDKNAFWKIIRDLQAFLRIDVATMSQPEARGSLGRLEDEVDAAFQVVYGVETRAAADTPAPASPASSPGAPAPGAPSPG
jgi:hypothetical protein